MSNSTEHPRYWVITKSEEAKGPYPDYESAFFFASQNLEAGTWTITKT